MSVTIRALSDVVGEVFGTRRFKGFRGQFSLLEAVLSHGTMEIKHPRLCLRGYLDLKHGEPPVVWEKDTGKIFCQALRDALRAKLGANIVASGVPPLAGEGHSCHWEGVIPLGPAVSAIMATVRDDVRITTYGIRRLKM